MNELIWNFMKEELDFMIQYWKKRSEGKEVKGKKNFLI